MGSLALVAKGKKIIVEGSKSDISDCELSKEEYDLIVSNTKRFGNPQKEEVKNDGKLVGDSGYDCKDCHGKNHLTKGCILKRLNEKKDEGEEKYEAYNLIIFGS